MYRKIYIFRKIFSTDDVNTLFRFIFVYFFFSSQIWHVKNERKSEIEMEKEEEKTSSRFHSVMCFTILTNGPFLWPHKSVLFSHFPESIGIYVKANTAKKIPQLIQYVSEIVFSEILADDENFASFALMSKKTRQL